MKQLAIAICGLISIGTLAQESITITYREAIQTAISRNVDLRKQHNQLRVNEVNKTFNYAGYLPNVNVTGRLSQLDGQQFDQVRGGVFTTKSDRFNASLNASLTLFNGFNRINSIKRANLQLEAQKDFVERTRQQIIFNVTQQYLQILLDKELLRIAEDNLEFQNTTLEQVQAYVELGSRALTDQFTQEATMLQADVQRIRAQNTFRIDKAVLVQTLQLEPGIDIDPVLPEWGVEDILVQDYNLNELYAMALEKRPDHKANQHTLEANERSIQMANSGYYPSMTAFFNYGSNFSSLVATTTFTDTNQFDVIGFLNNDPSQPVFDVDPIQSRSTSEVPFNDQFFNDNLIMQYGVSFVIPIFDGFQTRLNKANAKLLYQNSQEDLKNIRRTIYSDVQNAYLDLLAAKENYFATQKQFEAAETALELQTESYNLGIGDLVQLAQANNQYVQAAAAKAQAEYTLLFQKIILDYQVGILSEQ